MLRYFLNNWKLVGGNEDKLEKIDVYYNEGGNDSFVPRSVMVDLVS